MRTFTSVIAFALVVAGAAFRSASAQVAPPQLAGIPLAPASQIPTFESLRTTAENGASWQERRRAMKHIILLLQREQNDQAARDWQARFQAFVSATEANLISKYPRGLPPAPSQCDTAAPSGTPQRISCGKPGNWEISEEYELMAEAAQLRGEIQRYIVLREASILWKYTSPSGDYWSGLAREAVDAGEYETALRVCDHLRAEEYRIERPSGQHERCIADAHFRTGHWGEWLAVSMPRIRGAQPDDTTLLLQYCIAATRGARSDAHRACSLARRAANAREIAFEHRARAGAEEERARASQAGSVQRHVSSGEIELQAWRNARLRVDEVLSGCHDFTVDQPTAKCAMPEPLLGLSLVVSTGSPR